MGCAPHAIISRHAPWCPVDPRGRGRFGLKYFVPDMKAPKKECPVINTRVKCASQRKLAPVVLQLAREYDDGSTFRQMRTKCLENLCKFYEILENASMYLTSSESHQISECVEHALIYYGALASEARRLKQAKWSTVNKHHFFWHVGASAQYINCRLLWCYQNEDFMRHIGKVASSVMVGSHILECSRKVTERWRIGRSFDMRRKLGD